MKAFFFCLLCLVGITVGCGGGGSSAGGNPTPTPTPTPLIPLETRLRTIKTGDAFSYTFSRQARTTQEGVPSTITSTGTMNTAISSGSLDNQNYLVQNNVATYLVNGQPITLSTAIYFRQNPVTGDILTYAEFLGDRISRMTSPWATAFGTWQHGLVRQGAVTFTNGTVESRNAVVSGIEIITVPAGRFDTWRILTTRSSDQEQESGSYWYAPQLGTFVKSGVTVIKNDGSGEVTTTAELRSYSLL